MNIRRSRKEGLLTFVRRKFSPSNSEWLPSPPPSPTPPSSSNPASAQKQVIPVASPSTPLQRGFVFPPTPDPSPPRLETAIDSQSPLPALTLQASTNSAVLGVRDQQDNTSPQSNSVAASSTKSSARARSAQGPRTRETPRLRGTKARGVLSDIRRLEKRTFRLPKTKEQITRTLPYKEYLELCDFIENHAEDGLRNYWDNELRFDYLRDPPRSGKNLLIHMPGSPHEAVVGAVTTGITDWLKDVREKTVYHHDDKTTKDIAESIESRASEECYLENGDTVQPDGSFAPKGEADLRPTVLFEVSYTERPKDLKDKAERWIRFSNSDVRVVVGFDLNDVYETAEGKKSKKKAPNKSASLYVWKPGEDGEPELVVDTKFRNEKGETISNISLHLSLSDFVYEKDMQGKGKFANPELLIPLEKISEDVERGVKRGAKRKEDRGRIAQKAQKAQKARSPLWIDRLRKRVK